MNASLSRTLSTFGKLPCAQCGASLIAPVWSEFLDEQRVRHLWNCDDCTYVFETLVTFCPSQAREMGAPSLAA